MCIDQRIGGVEGLEFGFDGGLHTVVSATVEGLFRVDIRVDLVVK